MIGSCNGWFALCPLCSRRGQVHLSEKTAKARSLFLKISIHHSKPPREAFLLGVRKENLQKHCQAIAGYKRKKGRRDPEVSRDCAGFCVITPKTAEAKQQRKAGCENSRDFTKKRRRGITPFPETFRKIPGTSRDFPGFYGNAREPLYKHKFSRKFMENGYKTCICSTQRGLPQSALTAFGTNTALMLLKRSLENLLLGNFLIFENKETVTLGVVDSKAQQLFLICKPSSRLLASFATRWPRF